MPPPPVPYAAAQGGGGKFELLPSIRDVMLYSGLDYDRVLALPADVFLLMRKNHITERLMMSEEGRALLSDCERLKQTKMDYAALMEAFGG